ncbi:MAG: hypothetical protein AAGU78_06360 [Chloroflexota bacterium]|nr:hypothetical protein [Anaerolineae bacterium]HMM28919.1 hypothetical protein [Aggregatilineaceae bacterium]
MNRTVLRLGMLLLALALAACGTAPVKDVYTASGDATDPGELARTTQFQASDDLNVVVQLNAHSRALTLQAVFSGPDGTQIATDPIEADATVGEALLGLDWEAQGVTGWAAGEWQVEVRVDDETHSVLRFTVMPGIEPAQPGGTG